MRVLIRAAWKAAEATGGSVYSRDGTRGQLHQVQYYPTVLETSPAMGSIRGGTELEVRHGCARGLSLTPRARKYCSAEKLWMCGTWRRKEGTEMRKRAREQKGATKNKGGGRRWISGAETHLH